MSAQLLIQNLKAPPLTYKAILPYNLEGQLVSQDGGVAVGNVGKWPCVHKHWGTLQHSTHFLSQLPIHPIHPLTLSCQIIVAKKTLLPIHPIHFSVNLW